MRGKKGFARDRKNNFNKNLKKVCITENRFEEVEETILDKKAKRCIETAQKRERKLDNQKYKRALKDAVQVQKIARKLARTAEEKSIKVEKVQENEKIQENEKNENNTRSRIKVVSAGFLGTDQKDQPSDSTWESIPEETVQEPTTFQRLTRWLW